MKMSEIVKRIILLIILLLSVSNLDAFYNQEIEEAWQLQKFREITRSENIDNILSYCTNYQDSIDNNGLFRGKNYYWAQFHKSEGLELNDQYIEAIKQYHAMIKACRKLEYFELVAEAYLSLSRVYEILGRPVDCERNLNLALEVIDQQSLEPSRSRYYIRNASYLRIYGNPDSSNVYAKLGFDLGTKLDVYKSILDGEMLMGLLDPDPKESKKHFENAEAMFVSSKGFQGATTMAMNVASAYIQEADFISAQQAINRALGYTIELDSGNKTHANAKIRVYEIKRIIEEYNREIDSAYFYSLKINNEYKKLESAIDQETINELEIKFAIEQEKERAKNIRNILILASIAVVFLLPLIIALARFSAKTRRINKTISVQKVTIERNNKTLKESNQQKEILLSEIHHRVKNNLQLVISILTLNEQKFKDEEFRLYLQSLSEKVMSIAMLHDQLYLNDNLDLIDLGAYLDNLKEMFINLESEDQLTINIVSDNIMLNLPTTFPIAIIIAELINNSMKYARSEDKILKIDIAFEKTEHMISFKYKDNGPGFPEDALKRKPGNIGTLVITSMVRQLKADLETYNKQGAVFVLKFKEKVTSKL